MAKEITTHDLDEAAAKHEEAAKAHRAARSNPDAKAAYREASADLAALRRAHREQEIAAGRRAAPSSPGDGVAEAETAAAGAEVPSP